MNSIVKLSSKCEKCIIKNICNNKIMEACTLAEIPNNISNNMNAQMTNRLYSESNNTMEFRVNINKDVVADNIKEQLKNKSINSMCNFS